MSAPGEDGPTRLTAWLHGRVQGVGMRWWIRARALELGLVGWARNTDDGRVEVVVEGPRSAAEQLLAALRGDVDRPGRVTTVRTWASESRTAFGGASDVGSSWLCSTATSVARSAASSAEIS